ncbi:MAG TPA: hypothetical protein VGS58_22315 [Candidatus Sulfopaludibacter sp.]|nr:hypothetical protein [Candidatus Sulfopaludibacter sp.]
MAAAQTPPAAGEAGVLREARRAALNYSTWLPDLICAEVIHREADWNLSGQWVPVDTLTAQVTYFQRKESYKLTAHNGHPASQKLDTLTGAISEGEFGSMLRWIFEPDAQAAFEWQGRQTIRRRPVSVFAYRVDDAHSRMELRALSQAAFVGFHGSVFIDDETSLVLRLTAEVAGPGHFPIRESSMEIEYDWAEIAGHRYLVPVRAETRMTENALETPGPKPPPASPTDSCGACDPPGPWPRPMARPAPATPAKYRNRIEFRGYRKFTADSKLTFGGEAAAPAKH